MANWKMRSVSQREHVVAEGGAGVLVLRVVLVLMVVPVFLLNTATLLLVALLTHALLLIILLKNKRDPEANVKLK